MDLAIGEIFEHKCREYKVVENGYCQGCAFLKENSITSCYWEKATEEIPECCPSMRMDNKHVIFVEVSE